MGFLNKLRPSRNASRSETAIALLAADTLHVVGESFRQDALHKVAAIATDPSPYRDELTGKARHIAENDSKQRWFRAALFRDYNEHDHNSVCVHAAGVGLIGYLDRDTAIDYAGVFAELERQGVKVGACPAYLIGGGSGKSWGVVLALSPPDKVIADLRSD